MYASYSSSSHFKLDIRQDHTSQDHFSSMIDYISLGISEIWSVNNNFSLDLDQILSHPLNRILNYSTERVHLSVTYRGHPWATLEPKSRQNRPFLVG